MRVTSDIACPALYITRAATLNYQALHDERFETARKRLALDMASGARSDAAERGRFVFPLRDGRTAYALTVDAEPLLIVTKVGLLANEG